VTEQWEYDPLVERGGSQSNVVQIESLGKGGIAVVLLTGLIAVVVATLAYGLAGRAMDRATIAEREARIAQDKYTYAQIELSKRGIDISTDGH
jgi:hypothetical protein